MPSTSGRCQFEKFSSEEFSFEKFSFEEPKCLPTKLNLTFAFNSQERKFSKSRDFDSWDYP